MVLQNKYKARASARYNASRGGGAGVERGQRGSRGRGRGGARGRGHGTRFPHGSGGGEDDVDGDEDGDEDDEDGEGEDEEESAENASFPTLQASAQAGPSRRSGSGAQTGEERVPAKYARRKLESNAWRYKQDEAEDDPDAEPEPEVDLTELFARVAKLDSSKHAVVTLGAPQSADAVGQQETAEDIEADIDHSLAYLYEREQARERARTGRAKELQRSTTHVVEVASMSAEERSRMEQEAEEMKADKEKADALRALKERFQGRAIGERARTSNVRRLAPTAQSVSPSQTDVKGRDRGPKPAHLQQERDRLPSHARSWAQKHSEEDADTPQDDDFFDQLASRPAQPSETTVLKPAHEPVDAMPASSTRLAKAAAIPKPASSAKDMEDFLDAMLG